MCIIFRVDASTKIGSGHLSRCLALADVLIKAGKKVRFVTKNHPGNVALNLIRQGVEVTFLSVRQPKLLKQCKVQHANWLGGTQQDDAMQTINAISDLFVECLIVDHYAIDSDWHKALRPFCKRLMVIDDLGDRDFDCDLLLDQNLGSTAKKYKDLAPKSCQLLLGPFYALLRDEFSTVRAKSLARRDAFKSFENILISMGGSDPDNYTKLILNELEKAKCLVNSKFNIILGPQYKYFSDLKNHSKLSNLRLRLFHNVSNIAEFMQIADLAIGASGSTSWERCCLGLPSIQFIVADNQVCIAKALEKKGAIKICSDLSELIPSVANAKLSLKRMSFIARDICDGLGATRVANTLLETT